MVNHHGVIHPWVVDSQVVDVQLFEMDREKMLLHRSRRGYCRHRVAIPRQATLRQQPFVDPVRASYPLEVYPKQVCVFAVKKRVLSTLAGETVKYGRSSAVP